MVRLFVPLILMLSSNCLGTIIIDDFNDDLRVVVPAQLRSSVFSDGVGDLDARRQVFLSASGTRPSGFLDVNGVQESHLTVSYPTTSHSREPQGIIGPAFYVSYDIGSMHPGGVDLTDRGNADALVLDLNSFTASYPSWRFELTARSNRGHYVSRVSPVTYREDPHQLVFPFESFVVGRGALDPVMDFTSATEVSVFFEMGISDPEFPESIDLLFSASRFRTGTTVPEPPSFLFMLGILLLLMRKDFMSSGPVGGSKLTWDSPVKTSASYFLSDTLSNTV